MFALAEDGLAARVPKPAEGLSRPGTSAPKPRHAGEHSQEERGEAGPKVLRVSEILFDVYRHDTPRR